MADNLSNIGSNPVYSLTDTQLEALKSSNPNKIAEIEQAAADGFDANEIMSLGVDVAIQIVTTGKLSGSESLGTDTNIDKEKTVALQLEIGTVQKEYKDAIASSEGLQEKLDAAEKEFDDSKDALSKAVEEVATDAKKAAAEVNKQIDSIKNRAKSGKITKEEAQTLLGDIGFETPEGQKKLSSLGDVVEGVADKISNLSDLYAGISNMIGDLVSKYGDFLEVDLSTICVNTAGQIVINQAGTEGPAETGAEGISASDVAKFASMTTDELAAALEKDYPELLSALQSSAVTAAATTGTTTNATTTGATATTGTTATTATTGTTATTPTTGTTGTTATTGATAATSTALTSKQAAQIIKDLISKQAQGTGDASAFGTKGNGAQVNILNGITMADLTAGVKKCCTPPPPPPSNCQDPYEVTIDGVTYQFIQDNGDGAWNTADIFGINDKKDNIFESMKNADTNKDGKVSAEELQKQGIRLVAVENGQLQVDDKSKDFDLSKADSISLSSLKSSNDNDGNVGTFGNFNLTLKDGRVIEGKQTFEELSTLQKLFKGVKEFFSNAAGAVYNKFLSGMSKNEFYSNMGELAEQSNILEQKSLNFKIRETEYLKDSSSLKVSKAMSSSEISSAQQPKPEDNAPQVDKEEPESEVDPLKKKKPL